VIDKETKGDAVAEAGNAGCAGRLCQIVLTVAESVDVQEIAGGRKTGGERVEVTSPLGLPIRNVVGGGSRLPQAADPAGSLADSQTGQNSECDQRRFLAKTQGGGSRGGAGFVARLPGAFINGQTLGR